MDGRRLDDDREPRRGRRRRTTPASWATASRATGRSSASPAGPGWKDTARKPKTSYAYTVAALDAVGNVSSSASVTVTTLADTQRPSRPGWFHKIARSGRYVTFDWSPSVDNVGVTKYYVYRVGRASPIAIAKVSRIRIRDGPRARGTTSGPWTPPATGAPHP